MDVETSRGPGRMRNTGLRLLDVVKKVIKRCTQGHNLSQQQKRQGTSQPHEEAVAVNGHEKFLWWGLIDGLSGN